MLSKIRYDFVIRDVFVDHPYEPVLCKKVKADILVFEHCFYGSDCDYFSLIVKYLYGKITHQSLYQEYGIYVLELFHDLSLRSSTFSICKEFFDYYDCSDEYNYFFNKFVTNEFIDE